MSSTFPADASFEAVVVVDVDVDVDAADDGLDGRDFDDADIDDDDFPWRDADVRDADGRLLLTLMLPALSIPPTLLPPEALRSDVGKIATDDAVDFDCADSGGAAAVAVAELRHPPTSA